MSVTDVRHRHHQPDQFAPPERRIEGDHVMRIFVPGASGWIGSAVVDELLAAGHEATGLARSDASAAAIEAKGAHVRRGDLDDLDSLRLGAKDADAVIHLANKHDWSN